MWLITSSYSSDNIIFVSCYFHLRSPNPKCCTNKCFMYTVTLVLCLFHNENAILCTYHMGKINNLIIHFSGLWERILKLQLNWHYHPNSFIQSALKYSGNSIPYYKRKQKKFHNKVTFLCCPLDSPSEQLSRTEKQIMNSVKR